MPSATSGKNITTAAQLGPNVVGASEIIADSILDVDIGAHTTSKITVPTTLLSGTVTKAQLATGTQGDVFIATTSGAAAALAIGGTGLFLKSQGAGADPIWAAGGATDLQVFTSSGTWTKPTGAKTVDVYVAGGGGGAGSGYSGNSPTVQAGGSGGGGGSLGYKRFDASGLGATETITIGAGGTGGASVNGADTNGNDGVDGGATTFGTTVLLKAYGGIKGLKGSASSEAGGIAGALGNGDYTQVGGAGGAAQGSGSPGLQGIDTAVDMSPRGGGAGSGITAGPTANGGAVGGGFITNFVAAGGAVGTIGNSNITKFYGGTGGGGGNTLGQTGGAGINGSGGGGGSANTGASGAGGAGGAGFIIVISYS